LSDAAADMADMAAGGCKDGMCLDFMACRVAGC